MRAGIGDHMKRIELYTLVWSKPMTHIGREFGMSDVAIRKHCKKYDIPTPKAGYWAKIAHGKKVRQPPLSMKRFSADTQVRLSPKPTTPQSAESKQAAAQAEAMALELRSLLAVPATLPAHPPSLVRSIRAAVKGAKRDYLGFHSLGSQYHPGVSLSKASSDRALRILFALATAADALGHKVFMKEDVCYWQIQAECFEFRLYELKDKQEHEATAKELALQMQVDERRARYPELYASNRRSYRTWDYFPSGRLAFHIYDKTHYRGEYPTIEKRWRDRKDRSLEESLVDIFIWLASATVQAKDKRLQIEERKRVDSENKERERRAALRRENAKALKKHINELLDTHRTIAQLTDMAELVSSQPGANAWASQRFVQEVLGYRTLLLQNFETKHFEYVFNTLKVTQDDDLLIDAL